MLLLQAIPRSDAIILLQRRYCWRSCCSVCV